MSSAVSAPVFHPERLVAVLGRFKVRYVLIGSVAARLQGYPWLVAVAEITPASDAANLDALATALKHLSARIHTDGTPDGLPFEITGEALARAGSWNFITSCGRLDVRFEPDGSGGFAALAANAVQFQLHGDALAVASLEDLARMKDATGRAENRQEATVLREINRRLLATL